MTTCPHAETTAILALFDEAPPDFAAHLAACADCQATLAEHRQTLDTIAPHLPAPATVPAAPPARRRLPRPVVVAAVAAAAVAALAVRFWPAPAQPAAVSDGDILALEALDTATRDDDERLLALELELALIHLEETE